LRQRGENEADSTKAKAPCVEGVSQETHEVYESDKADTTKYTAVSASTHAPQVPAEAKPTEGDEVVGEDQVDSINTNAVLVSTHALGPFALGTPEFNQVLDPAPSESPRPNKDDTQEEEGKNEGMSTKNHSRKASDNPLEKASNALTGMSVTAAAGSEKRYDVSAASQSTSLKTGEECLSTDAVYLTHKNFAAEGYLPEDEEEDLNLASTLKENILEGSSNLP
jgi:hypothetical protein